MSTIHLHLNEQQEVQMKRVSEQLSLKRTAVLAMALKELHDRLFPPPRATQETFLP